MIGLWEKDPEATRPWEIFGEVYLGKGVTTTTYFQKINEVETSTQLPWNPICSVLFQKNSVIICHDKINNHGVTQNRTRSTTTTVMFTATKSSSFISQQSNKNISKINIRETLKYFVTVYKIIVIYTFLQSQQIDLRQYSVVLPQKVQPLGS